VKYFIYDQQTDVTHLCVCFFLSKMEWTSLHTHIKLAYPHLTEGSEGTICPPEMLQQILQ
jgi:hypothetical protein